MFYSRAELPLRKDTGSPHERNLCRKLSLTEARAGEVKDRRACVLRRLDTRVKICLLLAPATHTCGG